MITDTRVSQRRKITAQASTVRKRLKEAFIDLDTLLTSHVTSIVVSTQILKRTRRTVVPVRSPTQA